MKSRFLANHFVSFCLSAAALTTLAHGSPMQIGFSDQGLSSIRVGDKEFLAKGQPMVSRLIGPDGKPLPGKPSTSRFDAATKTQTLTSEWGRLTCAYEPGPDGLGMKVTLENTGTQTLGALTVSLLSLVSLGEGKYPQPSFCFEEPSFTFFKGTEGSAVLEALDQKFPLSLDFAPEAKGSTVAARAGFGGGRVILDGVDMKESLAPGQKMELRFVLRVAPAGTDPMVMAAAALDAFRKANPAILSWPDRRPVFRAFFGGGLPKEEAVANLKDPASIKAPAPDPAFQQAVMKKIDGVIEAAKSADSQGVILWDLEGGTFPHAITYIGDPRLIRVLNPQMDLVADEAMQKLKDAGLRVGVTLRPSRVIYDAEKNSAKHSHTDAVDPFLELDGKVEYAKKRWGCTLFYVDTNFFWRPYGPEKKFQSGPLTADLWRKLRTKYPDTLFIPEFASTGDYASTAGYGEADMGNYGVPAVAKALYPDAFRVIVIEDADAGENFDRFVGALESGNSLMTFGQGTTNFNTIMLRRMQEDQALRKTPVPAEVASAGPGELVKILSSTEKSAVYHALQKLAAQPSAEAAPRLLELATGEGVDWPVRRAAVVALGKTPYPAAVPVLFELLNDKQLGLYADAARALAGQDSSVEDLAVESVRTAALTKGKSGVCDQIGAVLVLRKAAGKAAAIQEIFASVPESDPQTRKALLTLVGELRSPESEAFLLTFLSDPSYGPVAAAGLVRIGTASGLEKVKEAAKQAKDSGQKDLAGAYGRALMVK